MSRLIALTRLALATAIVLAVVATHIVAAAHGPVNPFNLYGYFTIQSNLIGAAALTMAGVAVLRGRRQHPWAATFRAMATTYLVIVGLVYAVLLAPLGVAGGAVLAWTNVVHHMISPVVVFLDWLLVGDRPRIAISRLGLILIYPLVWIAVVLLRGATDGWVPYPFLDPAQGYGVVAIYVAGICALFIAVGLLVLWISRTPGIVLRPDSSDN